MLKIKELRLSKDLTQKELADQISSTSKNIWAYENQVAIPPLDTLTRLADFFQCSIDYLTGREDDFGRIIVQSENGALSSKEQQLLVNFRALPSDLQHRAFSYMQKLLELSQDEKQTHTRA